MEFVLGYDRTSITLGVSVWRDTRNRRLKKLAAAVSFLCEEGAVCFNPSFKTPPMVCWHPRCLNSVSLRSKEDGSLVRIGDMEFVFLSYGICSRKDRNEVDLRPKYLRVVCNPCDVHSVSIRSPLSFSHSGNLWYITVVLKGVV